MNATEKKIRKIAVFLINAQTVENVAEVMNRIAVTIAGNSNEVRSYFTGLYEHIDSKNAAFIPLNSDQTGRIERIAARLLLHPHEYNAVNALVRLHHMLDWTNGESAMVSMSDSLYDKVEKIPFEEVV